MTINNPQGHDKWLSSRQSLLASLAGNIVVIGNGLDEADVINPDNYDRPFHTAINTPGAGAVILPPGTVYENGQTETADNVSVYGWGMGSSVVQYQDETADGMVFDATDKAEYKNFSIRGPGTNTGTDVSAFLFQGGESGRLSFDRVMANNWQGRQWYVKAGTNLFECDIGYLRLDGDAGNVNGVMHWDGGGIGNEADVIAAYPTDANSLSASNIINGTGAGAELQVGFLNIGGSAGMAAQSQDGFALQVRRWNYEPTSYGSPGQVFNLGGSDADVIGPGVLRDVASPAYIYRLYTGHANKILYPADGQAKHTSNIVEVANDSPSKTWYWGDTADIDVGANATAGATGVMCLASAGTQK